MGPSPCPNLSLLCGHVQWRVLKAQEAVRARAGAAWALYQVKGLGWLSPTTSQVRGIDARTPPVWEALASPLLPTCLRGADASDSKLSHHPLAAYQQDALPYMPFYFGFP